METVGGPEEFLAERRQRRAQRLGRALAATAVMTTALGIYTLWSGRSLVGHLIGYFAAGVVAPVAVSLASRIHSAQTLRPRAGAGPAIALVVAANLICTGITVLHATYFLRRLV
jgi:hypothetical protein